MAPRSRRRPSATCSTGAARSRWSRAWAAPLSTRRATTPGRLIEAAGLKGATVGGVQVSRQHANFLINPGGAGTATAADVVALIEHVQRTVEERFGVRLESGSATGG